MLDTIRNTAKHWVANNGPRMELDELVNTCAVKLLTSRLDSPELVATAALNVLRDEHRRNRATHRNITPATPPYHTLQAVARDRQRCDMERREQRERMEELNARIEQLEPTLRAVAILLRDGVTSPVELSMKLGCSTRTAKRMKRDTVAALRVACGVKEAE